MSALHFARPLLAALALLAWLLPGSARAGEFLHIAVTAAVTSQEGLPAYQKLADYLTQRTGSQNKMIGDLSYRTINAMLRAGAVDVGFICGYPYTELKVRQPDLTLLAAPVPVGARYQHRPVYFSELVVNRGSAFQSLDDLRGKRLAFNSDISNSGYNMPRFELVERGLTKGFFGSTLQSGAHDDSVKFVAEGRADAAFVDSLVLDDMLRRKHPAAAQIRIIASLGPAPAPPVVARPGMPLEQRNGLQRALLEMDQNPQGRAILAELGIERFVRVSDQDYQPIRDWARRAKQANFMVIR